MRRRSALGGICDLSGEDPAVSTDCEDPLECTDGFCLLPDGVIQDGEFCLDNEDCINISSTAARRAVSAKPAMTTPIAARAASARAASASSLCSRLVQTTRSANRKIASVRTRSAQRASVSMRMRAAGATTRRLGRRAARRTLDAYVKDKWCNDDTMCNGHGDCVVVPELRLLLAWSDIDDFGGPQKYCVAYPNPSFPCPDAIGRMRLPGVAQWALLCRYPDLHLRAPLSAPSERACSE